MKDIFILISYFIMIVIGADIARTKELPQHHAGSVYIGNYAYFVAIIFIAFGAYGMYSFFYRKEEWYILKHFIGDAKSLVKSLM